MYPEITNNEHYKMGYFAGYKKGYDQAILDAMQERINNPNKLGRPLGKKNKDMILDEFYADIMAWRKLRVPIITIAKMCKVHPQTVTAYLNKHPELRQFKRKENKL